MVTPPPPPLPRTALDPALSSRPQDGDGHIQYNEFMNAIEAYNFRKSMKGLKGKGGKSAFMQTMSKLATANKTGDGEDGDEAGRERASTDSFESDILRMELDSWDP